MTYELRTVDVRPHAVAEAERRLGAVCAEAVRRGELAASLHTEIGPLNQLLLLWREGSDATADRASAEIADLAVAERATRLTPFSVSPPLPTDAVGPFFEVRTYAYADGELPKIVAAWEAALPARLAFGPLVLVASSEEDGANTLVHIWPYRSLDERWALRREIRAPGNWPPPAAARKLGLPSFVLLRQESKIAVPSAFSPLR